jgi:hypothetical protein
MGRDEMGGMRSRRANLIARASASAEELGLVDGADLDSDMADPVVGSLMTVIVVAYDAETFIIWEPA